LTEILQNSSSQGCGTDHSGEQPVINHDATAALALDRELLALCRYAMETSGLSVSDRYVRNHEFSRKVTPQVVLGLLERLEQDRLTSAWAKSFGAAHDAMQDALKAISQHADNQDIGYVDFRMHAKQQADFTLEQCAGSPGLLDPAPTPKPDWTDGQWAWADEPAALQQEDKAHG